MRFSKRQLGTRAVTALSTGALLLGGAGLALAAGGGGPGRSSCSPSPRLLKQLYLNPQRHGKAKGIAEIVWQRRSGRCEFGVAIIALGLRPNNIKHNDYAVWLYNNPADSHLVRFVNRPVRRDGRLRASGPIESGWRHFQYLVISLETHLKPRHPHHIVLMGNLRRTDSSAAAR